MPNIDFKIAVDTDGIVKKIQSLQALISAMASHAQAAGGKIDGAFSGAGAGANAAAQATERLANSETRAASAAGQVAREMQNTAGAARNAEAGIRSMNGEMGLIDNLATKAGAAMAGLFAAEKMKEFVETCVDVRSEFEKLEISFSTLLGSDTAGKQMFKELTDFATSTPLMEKDIAQAAQTMLSFNIESSKVIPLLKAIGDVSMGSADKFQSLVLSFSQATSLGKLQGGDRLQMINAGFNPLTEMARTTGKSMDELSKMMEKGQISAKMLEDAFISATSEGGKFNGMLEKQSKTMAGALSNAEGAFQKLQAALGEAIQPVFVEIINGTYETLNEMTEAFEKADIKLDPEVFKEVGVAIEGLIIACGTYKAATIAVTLATQAYAAVQAAARVEIGLSAIAGKALSASQVIAIGTTNMLTASLKAMTAALLNNPFTIAAAALAAFVATVAIAVQSNEKLEYSIKSVAEAEAAGAEACAETKLQVEELRKAAEDETKSLEDRKAAVDKLQELYPKYFGNLSDEKIMCGEVGNAYIKLAEDILQAAKARAAYELMVENEKEMQRLQLQLDNMDQTRIRSGQKILQNEKQRAKNMAQMAVATEGMNAFYTDSRNKVAEENRQLALQAGGLHNAIVDLQKNNEKLAKIKGDYKPETDPATKTPAATTTKKKKGSQGKQKSAAEIQADIEKAQKNLDEVQKAFEKKIEDMANESADTLAEMYGKVIGNAYMEQRYQLEAENAKTIASIEKQAQDQKDALLKGLQDQWNAQEELNKANAGNKKYVPKVFSLENLKDSDLEAYNAYINAIGDKEKGIIGEIDQWAQQAIELSNKLFAKNIKKNQDEEFAELLTAYGDYNEQRLQIQRNYDKELEKLQQAREVAELDNADGKNQEMVDRLEALVKELAKKRAEALEQFDFDSFSKSMNLGDIVGSVEGFSTKGLDDMAAALRKVIAANKDLSPEGLQRLQTLNEALSQIYAAKAEKNPVEELKRSLADFDTASAAQKLAQANVDKAGSQIMIDGASLAERYAEALATANEPLRQSLLQVATSFTDADGKALTYGELLQKLAKSSKDVSVATTRVRTATDACSKAWQKQSEMIGRATKAISKVGGLLKELGKDEIGEVVNSVAELGDAVMSAVNDVRTIVEGSADAMTKTGKAAFNALSAVEKASVILAVVSVALQVITKVFNLAKEMHNQRLQDDIDEANNKIEELKIAYEELEGAADKAFGKSRSKIIAEENKNLQRQNALIKEQIKAEEEMKESDKERNENIKNYKDKIRENEKIMAENKEAMIDAIFGEDIQSAIENFADAYTSALQDGTSVKKAAKQMVINMMKSMITESMKADLATPMQILRSKIEAMYSDNIISADEQRQLEAEAERISGQLREKYEWANKMLQTNLTELDGTSNGWATASQESIDELNGRFAQSQMALQGSFNALLQGNSLLTAINGSLGALNSEIGGLQLLAVQANGHLDDIKGFCKRLVAEGLPHFANMERKINGM